MSDITLVLTVIGDDRPGIVEALASTISAHQGNWLESSMAHLGGKFAGIVEVSVPGANARPLRAALSVLPGLRIAMEESQRHEDADGRPLHLALVGHDRVGIVREVSEVLARHRVNVEALATYTASAAMSAETLFHAEADLLAPASIDLGALQADLERLSDDLMVELEAAGS